jgi:hypothetical protein
MGYGKAKGGSKGEDRGPYAQKSSCKWCELGECWGCSTGKGGGKGGGGKDKAPNLEAIEGALEGVPQASPEEVQEFLDLHSVDDHVIEKLNGLDARLQKVVISKGSLEEARDQSAMLMGRIKSLNMMKSGEWVCSSCFDHQFSKNEECRRCGTAKQW